MIATFRRYDQIRADLIVTINPKNFPADTLDRWYIEAQHPDDFLAHQFHLPQPVCLQAVKMVQLRLNSPPKSVEDYLDTLRAQWLLATVKSDRGIRSVHLMACGQQWLRRKH